MIDSTGCMAPDMRRVITMIADPSESKVLLIGANNKAKRKGGTSLVKMDTALRGDECFAVRPRKELVVSDFDPKDGDVAAVSAQVEDLENLAANCGVPCIVADSGRGWHVYLVVGDVDGKTRRSFQTALKAGFDRIDEVRICQKGSMIRPIYVRHRHLKDEFGLPTRSTPVESSPAEVAARLAERPSPESVALMLEAIESYAPPTVASPGTLQRLPAKSALDRRTRETLQGNMPPNNARSEPAFAVACDAVVSGYTFEQFRELIRGTWVEDYHFYKQSGTPEVRIRREYDSAVEKVALDVDSAKFGGDDHLRAQAAFFREAMLGAPGLPGRSWHEGGHAITDAALEMVERLGRTTFYWSVRDAGLASGMSKSAAQRHLRRAERAGLLTIHPAERPNQANTVEVHVERLPVLLGIEVQGGEDPAGTDHRRLQSELGAELALCPTSRILLRSRAGDVWTRGGLGAASWRLYAASATEAPTAESLGHSQRRHQQLKRILLRSGLLDPDTHLAVCDEQSLQAAAEGLEVAGTVALRRMRYGDERERASKILERMVQQQDEQGSVGEHDDAVLDTAA